MSGTRERHDVTDRSSTGLSEFTWYSRLAAWIGAAMLLVQSVLGRDAGIVTILAVLLLAIGFVCFCLGLALDHRVPGAALIVGARVPESRTTTRADRPIEPAGEISTLSAAVEPAAPPDEPAEQIVPEKPTSTPTAPAPVASGPGRRPKFRERARKGEKRSTAAEDLASTTNQAEPTIPERAVPDPAPPRRDPVFAGVATELLTSSNVWAGGACARCANTLMVGQLVATCPECGQVQHAICWMENHFHCAVPNCVGHGSLEAPDE